MLLVTGRGAFAISEGASSQIIFSPRPPPPRRVAELPEAKPVTR